MAKSMNLLSMASREKKEFGTLQPRVSKFPTPTVSSTEGEQGPRLRERHLKMAG